MRVLNELNHAVNSRGSPEKISGSGTGSRPSESCEHNLEIDSVCLTCELFKLSTDSFSLIRD